MDPARGGWQPSGRMERMPAPPGLPFPRHPFVGPVDSVPETLWREIDNLVPPSLSILLPALNEEHGVEAVMKRIPRSTLKRNGLSFCVYLLDGTVGVGGHEVLHHDDVTWLGNREVRFGSDDHAERLKITGDVESALAFIVQEQLAEIYRSSFRTDGPQDVSHILRPVRAGRAHMLEI